MSYPLQGRVDLLVFENRRNGSTVPVWLCNGASRLVDLRQPVDRRLRLGLLAVQLDLAARRSQSSKELSEHPSLQPRTSHEPTPAAGTACAFSARRHLLDAKKESPARTAVKAPRWVAGLARGVFET